VCPSPRHGSGFAYVPAHGFPDGSPDFNTIYLYGGKKEGQEPLGETWKLPVEGAAALTWSQVTSDVNLGVLGSPRMVYYPPPVGKIVLYGGARSSTEVSNETWIHDGSQTGWTKLRPFGPAPNLDCVSIVGTNCPLPLSSFAMDWDPDLNQVVMFGGFDGDQGVQQRTWTLSYCTNPTTCPGRPYPAPALEVHLVSDDVPGRRYDRGQRPRPRRHRIASVSPGRLRPNRGRDPSQAGGGSAPLCGGSAGRSDRALRGTSRRSSTWSHRPRPHRRGYPGRW